MTKKTPTPTQRPRWQSLLGTGILLLVVLFVYLRTGTVPDELLEGVLGTTTATVTAEAPTAAAPVADAPGADTATPVAVIEATATESATTAPTTEPAGTPTAILAATEQPTAASTATDTSAPTRQSTATSTATRPPTRAPPTVTPTPTAAATAAATAAPTRIRTQSGLPYILYNDLPPEAQETIRLIDNNGPFPFRQDDSTFQNREGFLPSKPFDWYREFTVITPGSRDRGARRIVEGEDGLLFYTDDHYASFREVIR